MPHAHLPPLHPVRSTCLEALSPQSRASSAEWRCMICANSAPLSPLLLARTPPDSNYRCDREDGLSHVLTRVAHVHLHSSHSHCHCRDSVCRIGARWPDSAPCRPSVYISILAVPADLLHCARFHLRCCRCCLPHSSQGAGPHRTRAQPPAPSPVVKGLHLSRLDCALLQNEDRSPLATLTSTLGPHHPPQMPPPHLYANLHAAP